MLWFCKTEGFWFMNIHEYQAKKILSKYGIKIPEGMIAYTPNEAKNAAEKISSKGPWMLKAQIHAGARRNGYFFHIISVECVLQMIIFMLD